MKEIVERKIELPAQVDPRLFWGREERNLRFLEDQCRCRIIVRGHLVKILADEPEADILEGTIQELIRLFQDRGKVAISDIQTVLFLQKLEAERVPEQDLDRKSARANVIRLETNPIRPRSEGQNRLIKAIQKNDIVFAIGPAGTGKTYLATAMAVSYLNQNRVKKIILARPAVEAGESLGFLPGDFREKIDPYLKPLYDALEDMIPIEKLKRYFDQEIIEILPLAYMRGRTLNNAFIILDEAQNSTFTQMKMFLTRLGVNAKAVITGDITQIDLPDRKKSGLLSSIRVLEGIKGIAFVFTDKEDVVRHELVRKIIEAYDDFQKKENGSNQLEPGE